MFTLLEVTQGLFATLAVMSALALLWGRVYMTRLDKAYEASRWMLFALMSNLAVHYTLQIVFGFRAMGDDVGALVNLPFYSTATLLLSFSMLNILEGRLRRSYLVVGIAFCLPIWLLSIGACLVTGTMHQPQWFIFLLMTVYFIGLVISVIEQVRTFRRVRRTLDHDLGNPADNLLRHIRIGAYMLYATSIVIPFTLMTHYFMAALGLLMMPMFFIFSISFICLGSNSQGACEALAGYDEDGNDNGNGNGNGNGNRNGNRCSTVPPLKNIRNNNDNEDENEDDDVDAQIEVAIARWRMNVGFADPNLSITTLAHSIDVPQRQLSSYFSQHHNCTFRSWITRIRVEEAMALLRNNPQYSAETVAKECGFSSRSFFQTSFKAQTGMTPKEWAKNH